MTALEVLELIAKKYGYDTWAECRYNLDGDEVGHYSITVEAMQEYAKQEASKAWDACYSYNVNLTRQAPNKETYLNNTYPL